MYITLKSLIEGKHVTVYFKSNRIQKRVLIVGMRRPPHISRKKKKKSMERDKQCRGLKKQGLLEQSRGESTQIISDLGKKSFLWDSRGYVKIQNNF